MSGQRLAVFKGIEGSEYLLQVCSLVVLVSVVVHGFSPMLLVRGPNEEVTPAMPSGAKLTLAVREVPDDRLRATTITLAEYQELQAAGSAVLVDSRTDRTYAETDAVPDSVRVHPDRAAADAVRRELPHAAMLAVFCA